MESKQIAWDDGSGEHLLLTYQGQGNGPINVVSDVNNGAARSQTIVIETTKGSQVVTRNLTVRQAACPFPVGDVRNFAYTGSYQEVELPAGQYKLQCWGAQGGSNAAASSYSITAKAGGKGGYSEGIITLSQKTTVRVIVGGAGSSSDGGFNGGGSTTGSATYNSGNEQGVSRMGGGGGATDIRLSDGTLLSRMIVAGGGAGGAMCYKRLTSSASYNKTYCTNLGGIGWNGQPGNTYWTQSKSRSDCTISGTILRYNGTEATGFSGWGCSPAIYFPTNSTTLSYSNIWTNGATTWAPLCIYNSSGTVIWRGTGSGSVNLSTLPGASYYRFFYSPDKGNGDYPSITVTVQLYYYYSDSISLSGYQELSYSGIWNNGGTSWVPLCIYNDSGTVLYRGSGSGTVDLTNLTGASYFKFMLGNGDDPVGTNPVVTLTSISETNESQVGGVGGGTQGGAYSSSYAGKQNAAGSGGSFGQGANQGVTNHRYCSGAGGGGWYGGGGGSYSDAYTDSCQYSGGGSGFVNTAANAQYRPSGYTGLQLDSGTTHAGDQSFPAVNGGNETGHSGNGCARITRLI